MVKNRFSDFDFNYPEFEKTASINEKQKKAVFAHTGTCSEAGKSAEIHRYAYNSPSIMPECELAKVRCHENRVTWVF